MNEHLTRRELLAGAGKLTAIGGVAALSGGSLGILAGCGGSTSGTGTQTSPGNQSANLPYPYTKLTAADIKQLSEAAHENWFKGFCAFATFSGIMSVLIDKVGEPYSSFPIEVITFAHGGTAGWGATCGTLIGAGLAASLATGTKDGESIISDVMKWYSETSLPIYVPDRPKAEIKSVSTSNSPLCHVSVGKWMAKEGVGFASPQQMERCARVAADVAGKTVELLNARADNMFTPVYEGSVKKNGLPSQNNCTECHTTNVPAPNKPGGGEGLLASGS